MGLTFDTQYDPLVLQRFSGPLAYADVDAHFTALEEYSVRMAGTRPNWRPAVFADMRKSGPMDARGRQRVSQCFERLGPVLGKRVVAHAVIAPGKVASGVLTAILWITRPPWPIRAFSDPDEAQAWILRRFAEEGLPPPRVPPRWWERARQQRDHTA